MPHKRPISSSALRNFSRISKEYVFSAMLPHPFIIWLRSSLRTQPASNVSNWCIQVLFIPVAINFAKAGCRACGSQIMSERLPRREPTLTYSTTSSRSYRLFHFREWIRILRTKLHKWWWMIRRVVYNDFASVTSWRRRRRSYTRRICDISSTFVAGPLTYDTSTLRPLVRTTSCLHYFDRQWQQSSSWFHRKAQWKGAGSICRHCATLFQRHSRVGWNHCKWRIPLRLGIM